MKTASSKKLPGDSGLKFHTQNLKAIAKRARILSLFAIISGE